MEPINSILVFLILLIILELHGLEISHICQNKLKCKKLALWGVNYFPASPRQNCSIHLKYFSENCSAICVCSV